ncbi:MAG TPA: ABC transporter ATP-binding protein [Acidimicrobiia bacterium]|jgi:ABC-type branched-subunit amino acid transport system ATPase component
MALLEITGLEKSFGGLHALQGVDFTIDEGEIVSVIGPNGAGKTSFFNVISGLFPPDAGSIIFDGDDLAGHEPNEITTRGIARTFQNVRLFPNMTVLENVMVAQHCRTKAGLFGSVLRTPRQRAEERMIEAKAKDVLSFFGTRLAGYRYDQPAFVLSYANRRRLEIARAMATEPRLLLLDEPTAGMNPRETVELTELIGKLRSERGFTVVLIEHDMKVVRDVSDRVVVLDHGIKLAEGSYDQVSSNDQVIEAYLGRPAERNGGEG